MMSPDTRRKSDLCDASKYRIASGKAMKRTGTMVLLPSHSPGWHRDHAMRAVRRDPREGERPMERKAFRRLMCSHCRGVEDK